MSTTEHQALDRASIAKIDPTDQLGDILALPEHLRDAQWKAESAGLTPWDSPAGMVVAGMGGSAIGGALARAALSDQASRPLINSRAYGVPPWTTPDTTVLCASYSGNTEETLASYEAGKALGAKIVVVSSGGKLPELARADGVPVIPVAGGLQPRAAVGYMTVAALQVAGLCGLGPKLSTSVDVTAERLEELVVQWGPDAPEDSLAKSLARKIHGSVPIIAGAGLTAAIAYRWKTQFNENAKVPAWAAELPELDHNEIVGWGGAAPLGRFSAIFLDDSDIHPRVRDRIELTSELIADGAVGVHRVETQGRSAFARVFSLVLLGDLVSLYVAALSGIDPGPVEVIEKLKGALADRE